MKHAYDRFKVATTSATASGPVAQTLAGWAMLIAAELIRDTHARGLLRHNSVDPLITEVLGERGKIVLVGFNREVFEKVFG